jgi:hypothetical protein
MFGFLGDNLDSVKQAAEVRLEMTVDVTVLQQCSGSF